VHSSDQNLQCLALSGTNFLHILNIL
jgi:hypothetical protein